MNLNQKTILITGASSGIGYGLASAFAKEGSNLVLLARRKNLLDELAADLKKININVLTLKCDVTNKEKVKSSIIEALNYFGTIDIAILNAGIGKNTSVQNLNSEDVKEIFDINVLGAINFLEFLIPGFIKNKNGMIVGISSLAESRGFPKTGAYCASKAALSIFLESIRVELKKYGVKVLTVKPGFVKTPMTDKNNFNMPFIINLDKAVRIIIKGIQKENRIIQFPLPTVLGAKILKILPDFLYEYISQNRQI